jgi:hypothetical protein
VLSIARAKCPRSQGQGHLDLRHAPIDEQLNAGDAFAYSPDCRINLALAAACDENMGALLHEPLGRGKANAAVSACYYRNFRLQPIHGVLIVTVDFKFAKLSGTFAAYTENTYEQGADLTYGGTVQTGLSYA